MTVDDADLWRTNRDRLVLHGGDHNRTHFVDCPAVVVVDGRWLTLQGGEVRGVASESGVWRWATAADVKELPAL